ncbi:hypothetical protein HR13_01945 [Porphyromonas gulae]|uniref:type VI secretion system baseplate subunit TssF n=1 Tax=Porphyromonas gulae TaxID=111105 RepID=UPI0003740153|nr:type VI secretion system baseplate subunit TssF [Porphyromonas gulae]KGN81149.1 hypothetical protein HR13_01945 [Porphyromonas gulae]
MGTNYRESKEEIKDRMIRTALDFWGIRKIENLDPFIRLLIEAMSAQLHILSDEIADIEVRAMQRLSEVLLPESVARARPAHAIAYIQPLTDIHVTDPSTGFYAVSPFPGRKENTRYTFRPVCRTPLHKAAIRTLIVGNEVYEVLPDMNKKLMLRSNQTPESYNKVWIGLEFDVKPKNLHHLSFYIDFPNIDRRSDYLHLLPQSKWALGNKQLTLKSGLHSEESSNDDSLNSFFKKQEYDTRINHQILEYYGVGYQTIQDDLVITEKDLSVLPEELVSCMAEEEKTKYLDVCNTELIWVKVEFPPYFTPTVLEDILVMINTVPVANKELYSIVSKVEKNFGIVPLSGKLGELFLSIIDVTDEENRIYTPANGYKNNTDNCTYTLRQGGCESFDRRNAKDFLQRLQNLLEDEMGVFSSSKLGNNTDSTYIIERLITKISRESKGISSESGIPFYLFVDSPQAFGNFYVRYWATLGNIANGIRAGIQLQPEEPLFGEVSGAIFVTPTVGGASEPSERERIARFKYILSSRNQIVTNNDIRSFCLSELSDIISGVNIEKGIALGSSPTEGLIRTIDVHLIPLSTVLDAQLKQQIADDIHHKLAALSPMTFNYRVFVD